MALRPRLIEKALGYTKDEDDAEDLVGDCCVKVFEAFGEDSERHLDGPSDLEHWAFDVLPNLARDFLKRAKIVNSEDTRESIRERELRRRESGSIRETAQGDAHTAVAALPRRQRMAIELHLQGFSNQEVAQKMGIAIATVRALRRNAHRRMSRMLVPTA